MIYEPLHQEGVAAVVSSSTHPPRSSVTMSSSSPRLPSDPLHRSILAVDIEGYSRPERTNPIRARLRDSLYLLLDQAIGSLGIAPDQYEPPTDQGDGALVLFHPEVPKNRLLHPLIANLAEGLAGHNVTAPEREHIRLRVVVHAGELLSDEHGYFGEDLDDAFGLLNSNTLRACLTETGSPLALLVTHQIYEGIVKHELAGVDPVMYQRTRVRLKRKSIPRVSGLCRGVEPGEQGVWE